VIFIGSLILRNSSLLIGVFVPIWITNFVGISLPTEQEAKNIIFIASSLLIFGKIASFTIIAYIADKCSFCVLGSIAFITRAVGSFMFIFIKNPNSMWIYAAFIIIDFGYEMSNVGLFSLFYKSLDIGVRGRMASIKYLISSIGLLIFSKIFGLLFD
jgi:hypothetical protein